VAGRIGPPGRMFDTPASLDERRTDAFESHSKMSQQQGADVDDGVSDGAGADTQGGFGSGVSLRCRPSLTPPHSSSAAGERGVDGEQVRAALQASLQRTLGPYEPLLTYLQSVLVWERPLQCVLLYAAVNVVFW